MSVALYSFGALLFIALTFFYLGERLRPATPRRKSVLPIFTAVCSVAVLGGLVSQFVSADLRLAVARQAAICFIPPLMLHLILETEWPWLPQCRAWRVFLAVFYFVAAIIAALRAAPVLMDEVLYRAPAAMLAVTAAPGVFATFRSTRDLSPSVRAERRWIRAIFVLMFDCAAVSLAGWTMLIQAAPDYLILAFFSVVLYYRERLTFFDVLVKRGAFVAIGMAAVALCFLIVPFDRWSGLACAAVILAFWVAAGSLYPRLARAIDLRWLRRRFAPADAERQFVRALHGATDERDLAGRASKAVSAIFGASARVSFDANPAGPFAAGAISIDPRPDGIPFLSDDRRLLQALAGTLDIVVENVRFRVREQELRLLATRSELKALRAQINPHFLFNSLSVIAGLIQYRPEFADETIEHLAQVFRYTLRKSENEWAPLAEEIEFVSSYLRVEQARFGDRLQTELSMDHAAGPIPVPAMCVQPIIENAIKHGVASVPGQGRVSLHASLVGAELRIEVSDSGPGFPPSFTLDSDSEGHGLRNVAERLRGYYGTAARLFWEHGSGRTRVVMAFPAARAPSASA